IYPTIDIRRKHRRIEIRDRSINDLRREFCAFCFVNRILIFLKVRINNLIILRNTHCRRVLRDPAYTRKKVRHLLNSPGGYIVSKHIAESITIGEKINLASISGEMWVEIIRSRENIQILYLSGCNINHRDI